MLKLMMKNRLKSVKKIVTNFYTKLKHRGNFKAETYWVSLGENCLPDDILRRHRRKSFSSVYASGRSNIEYVLQMEKDDFAHLLTAKYLQLFHDQTHSVLRSTYYNHCHNCYSQQHMQGFEFSHHNPIQVREDYRAFLRRIQRTLKFRTKKSFIFLYHHRINARSDIPFIKERLKELLDLYCGHSVRCLVVFFWQNIIPPAEKKSIDFIAHPSGILEFVFHTRQIWGGDNLDAFWARSDDDLFCEMFNIVDTWNAEVRALK